MQHRGRAGADSNRGGASGGAGDSPGAQGADGISFGSYAGVTFSSVTPEVPQGTWKPEGPALPARAEPAKHSQEAFQQSAQQSHISLSDLVQNQAQKDSQDKASGHQASQAPATGGADLGLDASAATVGSNPAYLQMLASLAQEGELSSPGNSDTEESNAGRHAADSARQAAADSARTSGVHGLARITASGVSAGADAEPQRESASAAVSGAGGGADSIKEEGDQTPLALALAALVAGAQQAQQPVQTQQTQQQQHQARALHGTDQDQPALSSESSGDLLADAAAAAAAAGLSPLALSQSQSPAVAGQQPAVLSTSDLAQQQQGSSLLTAPQAQQEPKQRKHAVFSDEEPQQFDATEAQQERQAASGYGAGECIVLAHEHP